MIRKSVVLAFFPLHCHNPSSFLSFYGREGFGKVAWAPNLWFAVFLVFVNQWHCREEGTWVSSQLNHHLCRVSSDCASEFEPSPGKCNHLKSVQLNLEVVPSHMILVPSFTSSMWCGGEKNPLAWKYPCFSSGTPCSQHLENVMEWRKRGSRFVWIKEWERCREWIDFVFHLQVENSLSGV